MAKQEIKDTTETIKDTTETIQDTTQTIQDATQEAVRNLNTFVEPFVSATRTMLSESETYQQVYIDNVNKAIDNGHRLARQGLGIAASLGASYQKHLSAQVDRTVNLVNTFINK